MDVAGCTYIIGLWLLSLFYIYREHNVKNTQLRKTNNLFSQRALLRKIRKCKKWGCPWTIRAWAKHLWLLSHCL